MHVSMSDSVSVGSGGDAFIAMIERCLYRLTLVTTTGPVAYTETT